MERVPLGEVASINPRDPKLNASDTISFVTMSDLNEKRAVTTDTPRQYGEVSKGYTQFQRNDLLAAKIIPCWENGKNGKATITHLTGVGSTEFHVNRPS